MNSPHYFIGISVSSKVRKMLQLWQSDLRRHMTYKVWTHPDDFHITVKFLGACTDDKIEEWKNRFSEFKDQSFSVKVGPAAGFGKKEHPRVVHAEVSRHSELMNLKSQVEQIGVELGFPIEKRAYHPHVTLAKKWVAGNLPFEMNNPNPDYSQVTEMEVESLNLFQIHPAELPKYEPICKYGFENVEEG
ncbi:RNA 2',3'-cyclic phosphodiesterase [Halobacillus salinarum]|uniref:RNA 2',3'-cyclic phosphodiesterase n=1 Tax=Halobacillus salinarum TaxID=2932257 RepID=A0ABY4ENS0_9BACI|nr:RNA 2',3'-cyclic phosphodiesterase [Halobacillus salinarum]UOQ46104.1 RNA 2',3'-cyclic phosphodiesterase [Halobacillus salinarum]